jgi:hypothetical protein
VHKKVRTRVREVCGIKVKEFGAARDRGKVEAHWSSSMSLAVLAVLRALARAAFREVEGES